MKEIKMYQACDGTIFKGQDECVEYENSLLRNRLHICNIEFWDKDRHNMIHPLCTDEEYEDKMDDLYADSEYLNITKDIPSPTKGYIRNTWGWTIPFERGIYKYDWGENKWVREI